MLSRLLLIFALIIFAMNGESSPKQMVEEMLSQAGIKIGGKNPSDIKVLDERFYDRVLCDGSLGLGESYMEGWWECPAVDKFIAKVISAELEKKATITWAMRWEFLKAKFLNRQGKGASSKKVVQEHYEIGNHLYELMLGKTVAYSCGYWKNTNDLDEAQIAKFDLIAKKMGLEKGMRVLDIGCGWGGFAKHLAQNYGVEVVGVNLSTKQSEYARKISEGLPVQILNQDYRDTVGSFDRIISIGFMEHVGSKNYRELFEVIHRCLKEDGLALIHTIGSNTSKLVVEAWMDRYIFPNANIPSVTQLGEAMEGLFVMEDWHNFGADYATTLLQWQKNFEKNWDQLKSEYSETFFRMWNYYLFASAGLFEARDLQLWQIVISKHGVKGGYQSIR